MHTNDHPYTPVVESLIAMAANALVTTAPTRAGITPTAVRPMLL